MNLAFKIKKSRHSLAHLQNTEKKKEETDIKIMHFVKIILLNLSSLTLVIMCKFKSP